MSTQPEGTRNSITPPDTVPASAAAGSWLCALLQSSDSFYPTGSYAHSFGLESLVQEGVVRDRETLRQFFLQAAVPSLRNIELPLANHAWRALGDRDWERVGEICIVGSAVKASFETRVASENIGRQRAALVATLRGSELAGEFLQRSAELGWPCTAPTAAALEAHALAMPREAMLAGMYYTSISGWLSAAMKLLRLGQNAAQSLLTEILARAPEVIAAAEAIPLEEIGWFNPWLDIAAARHETAEARMFIS